MRKSQPVAGEPSYMEVVVDRSDAGLNDGGDVAGDGDGDGDMSDV